MKISEALTETIINFKSAGVESPELNARLLLADILQTEKFRLITEGHKDISGTSLSRLKSFSQRRINGEPAAYITGKKEFYSLDFIVTRDVLIPRPETEQIVDLAIYYAKPGAGVLDIGTGSGAIAIAIKKNRPDTTVYACDISGKALEVAKKNAATILGQNKIIFNQSDLFENYTGMKFDIIAANPPYLDASIRNSLQKEISFEPADALFAGDNGKEIIDRIIIEAGRHLNKDGLLLMEIGFDQGNHIHTVCKDYYTVRILKDFSNLPRVAIIQNL